VNPFADPAAALHQVDPGDHAALEASLAVTLVEDRAHLLVSETVSEPPSA